MGENNQISIRVISICYVSHLVPRDFVKYEYFFLPSMICKKMRIDVP